MAYKSMSRTVRLPAFLGDTGAAKRTNGRAFAEAVRELVDPAELIEHALRIIRQTTDDSIKIRAMEFLVDRGWLKPPQIVAVHGDIERHNPVIDVSAYSDEELATLENLLTKGSTPLIDVTSKESSDDV